MKRILLLVALFNAHFALKAQKVYFIYLQSESAAPFYVKVAGKVQSSTTEGYLIIPKLVDSTYSITIGQPGKQEEPQFSITINRADRGFLIKNFEGSFGLFDLQTLAVYKPVAADVTAAVPTVTKTDNFTRLLAKAADDTTLLNQPVVVQQPKQKPKETKPQEVVAKENTASKPEAEQKTSVATTELPKVVATEPEKNGDAVTIVPNDTVAQKTPSPVTVVNDATNAVKKGEDAVAKKEVQSEPVEQEYKRSIVTKKSESSTSEGFGLTFLDNDRGVVDTVQLTIPNPKMPWVDTTQKQQPAENKQFLEMTGEKDSLKVDTVIKTVETGAAKQKPQCAVVSTDDDFFKLRRDMAAKNSEDEMVAQAKKYFKSKCYRTEQIKYLSTLFLTDEGKYRFFDAAYTHVSDQERFASLQSEIKDSYYLNRFKALIGN